ncbi:MAG TPA: hypothetical protein VF169_03065 [Albitalea sp.]|uniref:hypothetical protein n=1 Tax=Piscinibacter sp. TaxID=1903157 RepID=UPI002ED1569A
MAASLFLPPHLAALDLGPSLDIAADALRAAAPDWLDPRHPAADRALRYGRGRGDLAYEEIADRTRAALPGQPAVFVQTRAQARREREEDAAHRHDADIDALIDQIVPLRHRALDLPLPPDASLRFEVGEEHVTLLVSGADGVEVPWTFALSHPPGVLMRDTFDAPAPPMATQRGRVAIPGVFWLPLAVVIERGVFPRFQQAREQLQPSTEPGSACLFISHRWLARSEPDPEGIQARFLAWQLFAGLCEAIELACDRGLHEARRASALLHRPVGRFGSELAESLLVNLLQPTLHEDQLAAAMSEVAACRPDLEDRGSAIAEQDHGLEILRQRIKAMPIVRGLRDRVLLWVDYTCLPQAPRDAADEPLFRAGLAHLNHVQLIGATAILLDEVDDYLGRGWCVLEAVTAAGVRRLTGAPQFQLAGSRLSTNRSGKAQGYNERLMEDAVHFVWRALLDTEVLACQTESRCIERLGLAVTDPNDLPFVYEALRRMQVPDAPTGDFEVVSGYLPLPFATDGASVYWRTQSSRRVADVALPVATVDVDWTQALRLQDFREAAGERRPLGVPPLTNLLGSDDALLESEARDGLHLAVVASCEAEASLLARWVRDRRADLEQRLGAKAVSISWLASDIVPVGCLLHGALQPWPCLSWRWVVIATESRLRHCRVTGHLIESMRALGRPYGELAVDRSAQNLRWYEAREMTEPPDGLARYPIAQGLLRTHRGGLYSAALPRYLLPLGARADA